MSPQALLWGTTDFVVERAQGELQTWGIVRFADVVCRPRDADTEALEQAANFSVSRARELGDVAREERNEGEGAAAARKEAQRAAAESMRTTTQLARRRARDLASVLPATCATMRNVSVAQFRPSIALVQSAVERDARALPAALVERAITDPRNTARIRDFDAAFTTLLLARYAGESLRYGDPLAALADATEELPELGGVVLACDEHRVASALFRGASLVRTAFDPDDGYVWDDVVAANPNDADRGRWMLLTLMVNAPYGAPWPGACTESGSRSNARFDDLPQLRSVASQIEGIIRRAHDIREGLRPQIGQQEAEADRIKRVRNLLATSSEILEVSFRLAGADARADRVQSLVSGFADATNRALDRDYVGAMLASSDIIVQIRSSGGQLEMPREVVRVATFATDVTRAKDSESVSSALTTLVSGGGGYLRKRNRDTGPYYSLNAYLGVFPGAEVAKEDVRPFGGPYLPLGVEIGNGSWSRLVPRLYLQFIDLGALASWRWSQGGGDAVEAEPKVGVAQVFSPGVYAVYPVPKAPFSVGIGGDVAPSLRKVRSTTGADDDDVREATAFRFGVFFAVDVPIFP
jgi:hypothetical protein